METNKLLGALCYLSIFFAGFIFPLIIYFISSDSELKSHAKAAFVSHILPAIMAVFIVAGVVLDFGIAVSGGIPLFMIVAIVLTSIVTLFVTIWNVYKGIKILVS